ncbi:UDP-4-amino-4-deoxy-L-arabinose--oxoglutarate aminotransferase [Poriferisphaera corsica]|uniref:UDP-4-amino-4-deoxy-L-arabinose--oxoglutarate aminotransferase n=1 Tax=Poriferisphaera corsica TaxID=2528020 RepID=A0A517YTX0_9BACT|nr:DegT/DnrJ/EryC1/StrS family aminotransferase [Poriferisphaera corsica]QDU33673.1 UDP-4-amino-4-deoxy-L-arabinose--oxoglutarate aminotransferase [Poriferisphaera corsica]
MSEIPLSQPDITDKEINAVVDTLRSGRLSIGPRRDLFEQMVAERCKRHEGIAVSSGTGGLHMLMVALGIGPGDEVITTPFSFIASANCILMVGAKPVFVDIDPSSLNIDPSKIEQAITPKTKAIIAVPVFGNTRHMDRIEQIAQVHEITLIEDACEALGGMCANRPAGSFGRASVFGFYPNKQITTGEGGMIVTNDSHLANVCRSLRNQGRAEGAPAPAAMSSVPGDNCGSWLAHDRLGYNYRLSEIACALGCAQMERLDEILEKRRVVASRYMQKLMDWDDLILPNVAPGTEETTSWFVFVIRLSNQYNGTERDRVISGMRRHEVGVSNYFPCIHLQPFYRQSFGYKQGDFPISESISQRTIALPFHSNLDETQIELVCHTLKVMLQREQLLKR